MFLARSYSHYSLLSAVVKVPALINDAKNKGYTSIALCDEDTTCGLVDFYDSCTKNEIKPVLGVTLRISNLLNENNSFGRHQGFGKVAILAKNNTGYKQLLELTTIARTQKENPSYHIDLEDLKKYVKLTNSENYQSDLFFIITDDHEIPLNIINNKKTKNDKIIKQYVKALGSENIIIELINKKEDNTQEQIKESNLQLSHLCEKYNILYIASPAPRYSNYEDSEVFKVILAIKKQCRIYDIKLERDFFLPKSEDLKAEYQYLPKAITNLDLIIEKIDTQIRTDYADKASEAFYPPVELQEGQNYDNLLEWNTYLGLITKFHPDQKDLLEWQKIYPYEKLDELKKECSNMKPDANQLLAYKTGYWQDHNRIQEYIDQIETELRIICDKGYSSYFLVMADMAQYCRNNNITASARGSGAGSLIGYLNNISTADTVYYKIPFERFLNPLRPSAPDIDLDVADEKRETVIAYLMDKYGQDRVCQVATYGTMLPRAGVRDIGRVLGVSYRKCDQLSKLIPSPPFGKKPSFKYAFENGLEFKQVYEKDEEVKRIIDIAKMIEGNYRHASVHAAAVLVTPTKLTDYASLQWDSDHSQMVCQYEGRDCEKIGIIPCKIDILGITNFSILSNAIILAQKRNNIEIDLYNIPFNDEKVYRILSEGKTMGIFQLSGGGMTKYLTQLKPTKVEDLMAMVALYRPGAMMSIPEFIKRKNDSKLVQYYVPQMQEWMEGTYGILVYQEDIMFTFMKLAGYNFGQADNIRRAMGKKKKEVLDREYQNFLEGCIKNNLKEDTVKQLWDLIVPFTDYSFNKAHSAAYGIVAYWTAYMKANYPAEFMTALMTSEEGNMAKIGDAINECRSLNITILPPDINASNQGYTIKDDSAIIYGLGSIKNLGSDVINFLIKDREEKGFYQNIDNFLERVATFPQFNKKSMEALICSGALDALEI
jgi:DNA polymerase III subunit alpha